MCKGIYNQRRLPPASDRAHRKECKNEEEDLLAKSARMRGGIRLEHMQWRMHTMSHHHTYYVTSSMSHHHTYYVTSSMSHEHMQWRMRDGFQLICLDIRRWENAEEGAEGDSVTGFKVLDLSSTRLV